MNAACPSCERWQAKYELSRESAAGHLLARTELSGALRDLLVDIDAFDKGGAFCKLRSYETAKALVA